MKPSQAVSTAPLGTEFRRGNFISLCLPSGEVVAFLGKNKNGRTHFIWRDLRSLGLIAGLVKLW